MAHGRDKPPILSKQQRKNDIFYLELSFRGFFVSYICQYTQYYILELMCKYVFFLKQAFSFCQQIQYNPIQEFHYLPKTCLQLISQYLFNSNQRRQRL